MYFWGWHSRCLSGDESEDIIVTMEKRGKQVHTRQQSSSKAKSERSFRQTRVPQEKKVMPKGKSKKKKKQTEKASHRWVNLFRN